MKDGPRRYQNIIASCSAKRKRQLAQSSRRLECRRRGDMKFAVGMVATLLENQDCTGVIASWDLSYKKGDGTKGPLYYLLGESEFPTPVTEGDESNKKSSLK